MIQIENVYKAFHQNEILKGVSLAVGEGEIFGLLGPSGVGKTTLVKIITGQIGADRGSVKILKKNVKHLTGEDRRQIGIMMDQFGVYERLSCLLPECFCKIQESFFWMSQPADWIRHQRKPFISCF